MVKSPDLFGNVWLLVCFCVFFVSNVSRSLYGVFVIPVSRYVNSHMFLLVV